MEEKVAIRNALLVLLGQASAFCDIDPLCANSVEMLEACKESGKIMKAGILALLVKVPKERPTVLQGVGRETKEETI